MAALKDSKRRFWIYLVGALLTSGLGFFLSLRLCQGLERWSYDLPLVFQSGGSDEMVMVFVSPAVKRSLGEPEDRPLNRRYHTRLVERLGRDGAKLIFFDFTNFTRSDPDPSVNEDFARVARAHGRVVVLGHTDKADQGEVAVSTLHPPIPEIANAVAGWGLADIFKDPDQAIRWMDMGTEELPSAAWVAAKLLAAPATRHESDRLRQRWVNYYGFRNRAGPFLGVDFDHALQTNGLAPGFFRDKIVIVCARPEVGVAGAAQDEFAGPHSRFGERRLYGGEVQAQILLNLLHGDWLERLDRHWEFTIIVAWGFLCAFGLSGRKPWNAALIALAAVALVAVSAIHFQLKHHVWWNWLIPVAQTPFALVWSVGYQYATESRRRRQLRRAFGAYLSPYMADRIADSEFDLALGGKEVEATVMFTDLEGFTKMSESLPPAEVSRILTSYFDATTQGILEQDGTIIKYIGDAVMAVWGAPMSDPRHAERAVRAAWIMNQAGQKEIAGRLLRTRIGINSGMVLAGNLGSKFRFDYTLIGDTTNFASRLEGLNKVLGTEILISEFTRRMIGDAFHVRPLGGFIVSGKAKPVAVYEVLGPVEALSEPPWVAVFESALKHYRQRQWAEAEQLFRTVREARGEKDGPAEFYLSEINSARANPDLDASWEAAVVLKSK